MNVDSSFVVLAFQHGWVFDLVIAGLVVVSLASWTVIFRKWAMLAAAHRDLPAVEQCVAHIGDDEFVVDGSPANDGFVLALIAGWKRVAALRSRGTVSDELAREHARYAWEAALSRELQELSRHLAFLATVGSVSPYVGLFGTVLGVIDALTGLKLTTGLGLASVAPGIAEALVATAVGLCTAIPAIVAHNLFSTQIERLSDEWLTAVGDAELRLLDQLALEKRAVRTGGLITDQNCSPRSLTGGDALQTS